MREHGDGEDRTGLECWTPSDLQMALESGATLLLDLRADWCPQCGSQERVLERLVPLYRGRVCIASLDVGEHPEVAQQFGVSGLPALLLFKDGELRAVLHGFKRAPLVRIALDRMLADTST